MRRTIALAVTALALAGCAGAASTDPPASTAAPTSARTTIPSAEAGTPVPTRAASEACYEAWRTAASVGATNDSVTDMYPVVRACDLAGWTEQFDLHHGLRFTGSAVEVLGTICASKEVASSDLCRGLGTANPDPLGICVGAYSGCLSGLDLFVSSGDLIAVCDYGNDQGDIVKIDNKADAEAMCSADGTISPSKVLRVVQVP